MLRELCYSTYGPTSKVCLFVVKQRKGRERNSTVRLRISANAAMTVDCCVLCCVWGLPKRQTTSTLDKGARGAVNKRAFGSPVYAHARSDISRNSDRPSMCLRSACVIASATTNKQVQTPFFAKSCLLVCAHLSAARMFVCDLCGRLLLTPKRKGAWMCVYSGRQRLDVPRGERDEKERRCLGREPARRPRHLAC